MFQSPNGVQIALAVWETLRKSEEEFQSPNGVQIAFGESLNGYINRLFQSPNGVQIALKNSIVQMTVYGGFNHQTVYRLLLQADVAVYCSIN